MKTLAIALATLCLVSAAAAQQAGPASITMDENSGTHTITWRGTAGRIFIRWKLIPVEGKIHVCGNYALKGHSMDSLSRKAIRDLEVRIDDKPILKDLRFFTRLPSEDQLVGGTAACKATGAPAPKTRGHRFSIGTRKTTYRN
ncbi:MAG: hypothetical protein ACP5DX_02230 [Paracoccaceae bacterium]